MGCSAVTSRMSRMHPSKSVSMLSTCSAAQPMRPTTWWVDSTLQWAVPSRGNSPYKSPPRTPSLCLRHTWLRWYSGGRSPTSRWRWAAPAARGWSCRRAGTRWRGCRRRRSTPPAPPRCRPSTRSPPPAPSSGSASAAGSPAAQAEVVLRPRPTGTEHLMQQRPGWFSLDSLHRVLVEAAGPCSHSLTLLQAACILLRDAHATMPHLAGYRWHAPLTANWKQPVPRRTAWEASLTCPIRAKDAEAAPGWRARSCPGPWRSRWATSRTASPTAATCPATPCQSAPPRTGSCCPRTCWPRRRCSGPAPGTGARLPQTEGRVLASPRLTPCTAAYPQAKTGHYRCRPTAGGTTHPAGTRQATHRQDPLLLGPHAGAVGPVRLADAAVEELLPVLRAVLAQLLHIVLHVQQPAIVRQVPHLGDAKHEQVWWLRCQHEVCWMKAETGAAPDCWFNIWAGGFMMLTDTRYAESRQDPAAAAQPPSRTSSSEYVSPLLLPSLTSLNGT